MPGMKPGMTGSSCVLAIARCRCARRPRSPTPASVSGGFAGGLSHPLFGPDHVAAMVAVGLWGAFLGPPAIYILPVVFPLVMAFGGVLGILGVPLPGVEIGIAVSAAVLGMMVALAARPPLWVAARHRWRLRDLPRPCSWRRASARRRCAGLFGRLRHRHRLSASLRHRLRPVGALACGTDRGARRRRRDCHRRADVSRPARMNFIARASLASLRCDGRAGVGPSRVRRDGICRRIAASAAGADAPDGGRRRSALLIGQQALGPWRGRSPMPPQCIAGLGAIALAYVPTRADEGVLAVAAIAGLLVALARPLPRSAGRAARRGGRPCAGARFSARGDFAARRQSGAARHRDRRGDRAAGFDCR